MIRLDDIIGVGGDKKVSLRPSYRGFLPYWLSFDDVTLPVVLPATGTIMPPLTIVGPKNNPDYGAVQIENLVFADSTDTTALAAWTIQLKDMIGRELMNRPIHIRAIAGTAQQPAIIYEPLFIRSRETLYVQLNKLTAGTANIRLYAPGILYDPQSAIPNQKEVEDYVRMRSKYREQVYPYWQTTEENVVLQANAVEQEFDIMVGENFEAFNLTAISTGNFAFKLTDVRSGQELMNGKVTSVNGLGNAQNPFLFADPYLILKGARLRFTFDDLSAAENTIYIALQGRRILAPLADFQNVTQQPYWMNNNMTPLIRNQIVGAM